MNKYSNKNPQKSLIPPKESAESKSVMAISQYDFSQNKKNAALLAERRLLEKQKHDLTKREKDRDKASAKAVYQLERHGIDSDTAKKVVSLIASSQISGIKIFMD